MHKESISTVGIVQLSTNSELEHNIKLCGQYIDKLAKSGVDIAFLPENAFYMRREAHSRSSSEAVAYQKEPDEVSIPSKKYSTSEHPGVLAAQGWAKQHGMWIVIGSIAPIDTSGQPLPTNRSVVINADGEMVGHYDKLHLFDVTLADGESYAESARIQAGDKAVVVDHTPLGKLGLSICYDIRFPGLYRDMAQAGAEVFSIPAAFTVPTGKAHWHVLQRARAIENGAFVIAAAQCGEHPGGRKSYGHSLVVNPWGEVLLDLGEEPGVGVVKIDLAEVRKARELIPSLKNGRCYQRVHGE